MPDRKPALTWTLNDPHPELARVPPRYNAKPRAGVVLRVEQRDANKWVHWIDTQQPHAWAHTDPVDVVGDAVDAQLACEAVAVARGLMPLPAEHVWRVEALRAVLAGLSDDERDAVLAEVRRRLPANS